MPDQKPGGMPPETASAALPTRSYPTRIRSLLGLPHHELVSQPVQLPPLLQERLPFDAPFPSPYPDPALTDVESVSEPSANKARRVPDIAADSVRESPSSPPPRGGGPTAKGYSFEPGKDTSSSPSSPTGVNLFSRASSEPATDESHTSQVSSKQVAHRNARSDPPFLNIIEQHAPASPPTTEVTREVETDAVMPLARVNLAVPGVSREKEKETLPVLEPLPSSDTVSPGEEGSTEEAKKIGTPAQRSAVHRATMMTDRHSASSTSVRAADPQSAPTTTQTSAGQPPNVATEPEHRSPQIQHVPSSQGEARDHTTPAPESPRAASAQRPEIPKVFGYENDNAVYRTATARKEGVRADRAAAPVLRTQDIEGPVPVPTKVDRRVRQLEKTVERLEARVEEQNASLRRVARPEPQGPARSVFVVGAPATPSTSPRAYWARSHLAHFHLSPRR
jgi:hypothetical protein